MSKLPTGNPILGDDLRLRECARQNDFSNYLGDACQDIIRHIDFADDIFTKLDELPEVSIDDAEGVASVAITTVDNAILDFVEDNFEDIPSELEDKFTELRKVIENTLQNVVTEIEYVSSDLKTLEKAVEKLARSLGE